MLTDGSGKVSVGLALGVGGRNMQVFPTFKWQKDAMLYRQRTPRTGRHSLVRLALDPVLRPGFFDSPDTGIVVVPLQ